MEQFEKNSLERYRAEMGLQKAILDILRSQGPKTVPEIAEALGLSCADAMMYLMAMRRYNLVEEQPKDRRERYFKYGVKENDKGQS